MRKLVTILLAGVAAASLSGCSSMGISNQTAGAGLGALAGGLLGSTIGHGTGRLIAVGTGVFIGAAAGSAVGHSMDEQDKKNVQGALNNVPNGEAVGWHNNNGVEYTFKPIRTVQSNDGQYCREFTQTATIAGKQQQLYGTACRQPDGTWKIVSA
jgi:surface antigen